MNTSTKALAVAACLFVFGCAHRQEPVVFLAVEAREVSAKAPVRPRAVFQYGCRPTLIIDGPQTFNQPVFVEVLRDGARYDISPEVKTLDRGLWLSMGQLPHGAYTVTLFVAGVPRAQLAFAVLP